MAQRNYLALIRRNWLVIVAMTVLGGIAAFGLNASATPIYSATSKMYFAILYGNTANDLSQGSTFTQNQMQSYAIIATTPSVLDPVIEQLRLDTDADALAGAVTITAPADTSILEITASSVSPRTAADIANAVNESLAIQVEETAPTNQTGITAVNAETIAEAQVPDSPSSPNTRLNLVAGLLLGLLLGVLFALARTLLDTRVRDAADVEAQTAVPVIGAVERDRGAAKGGLVTLRDPLGPTSESYRALQASLQFASVDTTGSMIVITSSLPGEGKSTIASNLAIALAEAEQTVALVDADLRRGTIARYSGLEAAAGLTTVLIGKADIDDVMQAGGHAGLDILPSGDFPPNPSRMLSSKAMAALLADLRNRYDVVLIDAAPLLAVADAAVLSQYADGVLVVTDVTRIRRRHLTHTLETLDRAGATVLGVVLNKVKSPDRVSYYGVDASGAGSADQSTARRRIVPGSRARTKPPTPPGRPALPGVAAEGDVRE